MQFTVELINFGLGFVVDLIPDFDGSIFKSLGDDYLQTYADVKQAEPEALMDAIHSGDYE